jgi:hypothetical protein
MRVITTGALTLDEVWQLEDGDLVLYQGRVHQASNLRVQRVHGHGVTLVCDLTNPQGELLPRVPYSELSPFTLESVSGASTSASSPGVRWVALQSPCLPRHPPQGGPGHQGVEHCLPRPAAPLRHEGLVVFIAQGVSTVSTKASPSRRWVRPCA